MTILGIHLNTHDSGATILKNGRILASINEERLSRRKMDGHTPIASINEVLKNTNLSYKDIDILAFSDMKFGWKRNYYFWIQQAQRVWYTKGKYLKSFLNPKTFGLGRLLKQIGFAGLKSAIQTQKSTQDIISKFKDNGFVGKVKFIPHDLAHAAGAYYSGGKEDAFVAVVEGSSFTNTCSFWKSSKSGLKKVFEILLPHSPGRYYEVVTLILGFHPKRHGGKITGLAALGNPDKCYDKVKDLIYIKNDSIKVSPKLYALHDEYFSNGKKLPKLFENDTKEDIASAFQKRLEDVVIEQIEILSKKYSIENLALSGGVFANVKLNMELAKLSQVKNIFIYPAMGDAGECSGAAIAAYAQENLDYKPFTLEHVYLGTKFGDSEIQKVLDENNVKYKKCENIARETAELLSQKKVVGFFQEAMEYGPRALGSRSILYPATDHEVNDWLNKQLKRTEFMPFAPVTLEERAEECYKNLDKAKHATKFMTIALSVTDYMAENMPAAVHIDKTARPQIINRQTNSVYYDTLKEYEKITGLPSLINTSFNMHEEPIVCNPQEALDAYKASNLDALSIGNFLIIKD
jgi:carbamoyltransferase